MRHYLTAFILVAATSACDRASSTGDTRANDFTPAAAGNAPATSGSGSNSNVSVQSDTTSVSSVSAFSSLSNNTYMMKNYLQLQTAMDACLGPGLGKITDDMFAVGACPNAPTYTIAADKTAILSATLCVDKGQNILSVNRAQLWDPSQVGRTVTLANNMTPGYLTALAQAADVYAHGVANPSSLCATLPAAQTLLQNCLSQYEPGNLATAAATIQALCAKGPMQARQALATVVGSVAFSVVTGATAVPSTGTAAADPNIVVNMGSGT